MLTLMERPNFSVGIMDYPTANLDHVGYGGSGTDYTGRYELPSEGSGAGGEQVGFMTTSRAMGSYAITNSSFNLAHLNSQNSQTIRETGDIVGSGAGDAAGHYQSLKAVSALPSCHSADSLQDFLHSHQRASPGSDGSASTCSPISPGEGGGVSGHSPGGYMSTPCGSRYLPGSAYLYAGDHTCGGTTGDQANPLEHPFLQQQQMKHQEAVSPLQCGYLVRNTCQGSAAGTPPGQGSVAPEQAGILGQNMVQNSNFQTATKTNGRTYKVYTESYVLKILSILLQLPQRKHIFFRMNWFLSTSVYQKNCP